MKTNAQWQKQLIVLLDYSLNAMDRKYVVLCLTALGSSCSLLIIGMPVLLDPVRRSLLEGEAKDWGGR